MKIGKGLGRVAASLFLALVLCMTAVPAQQVEAAKTTAMIHPQKVTINEGFTTKITLTGVEGKVKYSSSNKKVAKVNSKGLITGVGEGNCVITAKYGNKKKTCKVTVIKKKVTEREKYWQDTPEPQDGMGPRPADKSLPSEPSTLYTKEVEVIEAHVVSDKNMIVVYLKNPNAGQVSTKLTVNYTDIDGKDQTMDCHVMLIGGGQELFYEISVFAKKGTAVTATASNTIPLANNFANEFHQISILPYKNSDSELMSFKLINNSKVDLDYVQVGIMFYTKNYEEFIYYDSYGFTDFKAGASQLITVRKPKDGPDNYYNFNINYAYAGLPD